MAHQIVGIYYGVLSEPLSEQLSKQNLKYDKKKVAYFQKELNAINTLRFGTVLLTDSMVDEILPKLHKAIVAHVAEQKRKT
jgi:hypothetical protein